MTPSGTALSRLQALFCVLVAVSVVAWPRTARAWMDLRVVSDVATVELQHSGHARVSHELLLRVRGGPLKRFSLQGVDPDLVVQPGASLVLAKSGLAAGVPIGLRLQAEGDLLTLDVTYEKGVRSGSYLVNFAYETDLSGRGLIEQRGGSRVLSWHSPRFDDGIGSLKARFVVPRAEQPPSVWSQNSDDAESDGRLDLLATEDGVYLSELSRESDVDVLELTRPHAARGEQVTWRVRLGPGAASSSPTAVPTLAPADRTARATVSRPQEDARAALVGLGGLLAGLCLSILVWCKHRWLLNQAPSTDRRAAFLVRAPVTLRLALIVLGVSASVGFGIGLERATLGCAALALVMLLSIQHASPERAAPRGPGQWEVVATDSVFSERPRLRGAGVLLEGSTGPGLMVFLLLAAAGTVCALRGMAVSPYRSAALMAAIAGLTPLFFTLGGARLVLPRRVLEPSALEPYYAVLAKRRLAVELIARKVFADGSADEHRVRWLVPRPLSGFDSLELALEWHHGGWFLAVRPVFIARVRDGSPAHQALPRDAHWSRGRHRDERVALIRPAGSPTACLAKGRELSRRLSQPVERTSKPRKRVRPSANVDRRREASAA